VEGGDTNETITIDRSEADLEAGVIVNAWVNGEFLEGEHQFDVQCDQSTPTDENKYEPLAEFRVGATSVAVNESLTFNASASPTTTATPAPTGGTLAMGGPRPARPSPTATTPPETTR
jgi:hypothetical protein